MSLIAARLGLVQRVLPVYRAPFFDALAVECRDELGVFAGNPRSDEAIETARKLEVAHLTTGKNVHISRGWSYLCFQPGVRDWIKEWTPDVLVVEANPRYLSTPGAVRWMQNHSRPVIGWGLGAPAALGVLKGLRDSLRRNFLAQFDAMITYSQQGAAEYCAVGLRPERVFVAPNAAARRPVNPMPARPADLNGKKPVVLFVGRLQARKRVDLLLQACPLLPFNLQPDVWIVGDGPARADLETLARQVYPSAQFLGARFGADLENVFRAADLFVLPGTGGLALQQAMSFGLPVIAGEADGTQTDLVRPGNGWQLPPGDLLALIQTLIPALNDIPRLRCMGAESYRIASEEINIEHMVEVFAQAVHAVLSDKERQK